MKRRFRIVNKKRFYLFITSLFAVIAIIVLSLFTDNMVHSSVYEVKYEEVKVVEGDTLWNITSKYLSEDTDIRKMIYDIKKFNNMDTSYIYPGDIIKIPILNK
ncbi:LysM peptidoglycan-binding domain-containing protein [Tissierella sp.]|uniref:cell division suppressor protein YneA n=1 Tax=Tissierella sp. TaxID=41274 RepID=UPI00285CA65B|nr:LysM peptidoglycan-binding domain-containing protein [Tissierella sp.]MDR7856200.1 LysM peptidoglycan-binding domain-containing protein [Tissierella sp.]